MEWTKIKTKHFLFSSMSDREQAGLTRLLCLTAHLEKLPNEHEMRQVCGRITIESLSNRFQSEGQSLSNVLQKVLEDVNKIQVLKSKSRESTRRYREKTSNSDGHSDGHVTMQIREEKRREEKTIKKRVHEMFEIFYEKYPNKKAKPVAEKAFLKINPDEELFKTIIKRLEEHIQLPNWRKDNGSFIPYPATWLNQCRWKDVVSKVPLNAKNSYLEDREKKEKEEMKKWREEAVPMPKEAREVLQKLKTVGVVENE